MSVSFIHQRTTQPLFYVLMRNKATKEVIIPSYYRGLSVFECPILVRRRVNTLKRRKSKTYEFRILPWHTEMGEVDLPEMWRSALGDTDV